MAARYQMSRPIRALLGVALPVMAIAIFVALLAFSLMRLSDIGRDMRIEATQNMLWVISRAHIASLQLGEAVAMEDTDGAERELRYNVFLSRLALLHDGPQRRQMEELGFAGTLDKFRDSLPELGALVAEAPGPGQLERVKALLAPYDAMLGLAANKAMVSEWDNLGYKLDTSRRQLWHIVGSLIGISLAGAVLFAHLLMAIRDARRRARLLNKEKAFSQLLIGSSGEGIVAVDLEGCCTVWNEAAERLFGLAAAKTIGRKLADVSGFFEVDSVAQAIGDALDGRPAALFDQPFFPPEQAEPLYIDLRWFSLRDGEDIVGSILLVSDVTERRATQRKIAGDRDLLEHLVQERTRELDAALTRERATADLYRNFGTMISHQFRTPLAIVDSALQRLMRRSDRLSPEEVLDRGGNARHAIARLTGLVESTLDAARLDTGQIGVNSHPCDLRLLVEDICTRQSEQTPHRQIRFEFVGHGEAIAHCDPVHVENILINLLSNAIKYSPVDTVIDVTLKMAQGRVECAVTNHGTLECASEREALFERYYRGANAEGHQGIGIGLYMARTLARMQGGDVVLDNEGEKIIFTLALPGAAINEHEERAPALVSEQA